jgi:hypothetical protein
MLARFEGALERERALVSNASSTATAANAAAGGADVALTLPAPAVT